MVVIIGFGFSVSAQPLTSNELKQLYEKYPNAVRVYQDRVLELETIIIKCNEQIDWIKMERTLDMLDNDGNAAEIKKQTRIEAEERKIAQAQQDLQATYRSYRGFLTD